MGPTSKEIRVRIAPSPTGYLHIGTARTALFNFLFARHQGGKFVLRIEDTDSERSKKEFEDDIINSLKWLGITWDEGPIRQSERLDLYELHLNKLLKLGAAYYCFCSEEELEQQRAAFMAEGLPPKYNGKCRALNSLESAQRVQRGDEHVIRFRIPEEEIKFKDIIRGGLSFDGALLGDVVIAKDIRSPLYNFAVAVDDYDMKISHVIRGEDHLANTPKQIAIQRALGFSQPEYAHLPLILNPDRSKMSKRFAATAVQEYKDQGYLPAALFNFIAFLGWHPKDNKEILSREELTEEFSLERVQKAGAIFNIDKLEWINSQYLKTLGDSELAALVGEQNVKIVALVRGRMKKLTDYKPLSDFFLRLPDYESGLLIWKTSSKSDMAENLRSLRAILSEVDDRAFTKEHLESFVAPMAEKRGKGEVFWPFRVAVSGSDASPGPLEIAEALGKSETLRRLEIAIKKLGSG